MLPGLDIHKAKNKHSSKGQGRTLLFEAVAEVIALRLFSKRNATAANRKLDGATC